MDAVRNIRFLIAPFVFIGSLLWGLYWSDPAHAQWQAFIESEHLLPLTALIAGASLPLGFLIGSITHTLIALGRFLFRWSSYDTAFDEVQLESFAHRIISPLDSEVLDSPPSAGQRLPVCCLTRLLNRLKRQIKAQSIVVTFQHGFLQNNEAGVHDWLVRQWTFFRISANTASALALSFLGILLPNFAYSWQWLLLGLVLFIFMVISALEAWYRAHKALEFQAHRLHFGRREK